MKATIVPIGNSKGIRIPKAILEQCHMTSTVELETQDETIIIRPWKKEPRENWEQAFKTMHENNDDQLLIDDSLDINLENWKW